jgi:hypothetical protein
MKPGSVNVVEINNSIKNIETLTNLYKRKRITTEDYIKSVNENLSKLTNERDYIKYLSNIGQF